MRRRWIVSGICGLTLTLAACQDSGAAGDFESFGTADETGTGRGPGGRR